MSRRNRFSRRGLLKGAAAAAAGVMIVPRHVLGGEGQIPPSQTVGAALIGVGGRGPGTFTEVEKSFDDLKAGMKVVKLAECDVKWVGRADGQKRYTDFRRVLDRKDIDVVAIGTPPHWHALISIAAAEAGKDVLSEKPMTRTVAEGRAVVEASNRYKRVFQVGTFGRFGASRNAGNVLIRKIMKSGLLGTNCRGIYYHKGGFKVKEWSGWVNTEPRPVPANLDWDMYCGPSPLRPFHPHRHGGTHRGYWDYDGGGLGDMGQHYFDPITWIYGKDGTAPVEIEAHAPPAHPECAGMWGWVKLKYADGFQIVLDSGEWGEPCDITGGRQVRLADLSPQDQQKIKDTPDPEPLLTFAQAVVQRKQAGGNAEAAHRTVCIMHLANVAIRTGRKIRFDPVTEQVIGDEEANRLVNQPMRAPWHL